MLLARDLVEQPGDLVQLLQTTSELHVHTAPFADLRVVGSAVPGQDLLEQAPARRVDVVVHACSPPASLPRIARSRSIPW